MSSEDMSDLEMDGHLLRARKPAAIVLRTPQQDDEGMPGCWFGGRPTLPPEIAWPTYRSGIQGLDPVPLHFILQINLKYVPKALGFPDMPDHGTIFVFVEPMFAPQDFKQGPSLLQNDAATIIYVADDVSHCDPRQAPPIPDLDKVLEITGAILNPICESYVWMREGENPVTSADGLPRWPIVFLMDDTFPTTKESLEFPASREVLRRIDDCHQSLWDRIYNFQSDKYVQGNGYARKTPHQLFGWHNLDPFPDRACFDRLRVRASVPSLSDDDVLFLTLHSEDAMIGFQYPGGINLAFWVNKADLAKGDFGSLTVWEQ